MKEKFNQYYRPRTSMENLYHDNQKKMDDKFSEFFSTFTFEPLSKKNYVIFGGKAIDLYRESHHSLDWDVFISDFHLWKSLLKFLHDDFLPLEWKSMYQLRKKFDIQNNHPLIRFFLHSQHDFSTAYILDVHLVSEMDMPSQFNIVQNLRLLPWQNLKKNTIEMIHDFSKKEHDDLKSVFKLRKNMHTYNLLHHIENHPEHLAPSHFHQLVHDCKQCQGRLIFDGFDCKKVLNQEVNSQSE